MNRYYPPIKEVPKHLEKYKRFSLKYTIKPVNRANEIVSYWTYRILHEQDGTCIEGQQHLLEGGIRTFDRVRELTEEGMFVEDKYCNKDGIAIDWLLYYKDQCALLLDHMKLNAKLAHDPAFGDVVDKLHKETKKLHKRYTNYRDKIKLIEAWELLNLVRETE